MLDDVEQNPYMPDEFPGEGDILPDDLDREIPDDIDNWVNFHCWLGSDVEGEKKSFLLRQSIKEFDTGRETYESVDGVNEAIRDAKEAIAYDRALRKLLESRMKRRQAFIDSLLDVREEVAEEEADAAVERLKDAESANDDE